MDIYTDDRGTICGKQPIDTETYILFQASNLRRQPTGLHATITLTLFHRDIEHDLEDDTFNVQRREDRQRLAFGAHRYLESMAVPSCEKESLKHGLDVFCRRLDSEWLKQFYPTFSEGREPTPLQYWLTPFVPKDSGVVVFAPPGRGKTFMGLLWARCIASNLQHIWPTNAGRVLYINLERSRSSLERRLGQVNRALDLDQYTQMWMLHARGKSLDTIYAAAARCVAQEGIDVVFLDSMSRSGRSLIDDAAVNTIMDMLNGLCPTWVLLAHTPRADETHSFGSIMTDAAVDLSLPLLTQEKLDQGLLGIGIHSTKANDMPPIPLSIYALEFTRDGLTAIRKAKPNEFIEIESQRKKPPADSIYDYLLDTGKAGAMAVAEAVGIARNKASGYLNNDPRFQKLGKDSDGKTVLFGVKQGA